MTTPYVPKFYEMDPKFDALLFSGEELKDGMIVLIADPSIRVNITDYMNENESANEYEFARARENNRWCTVSRITVTPRFERDKYGDYVGEGSPLISFIATYADGVQIKRTFDASYAWLVKKDSIPSE